MVTKTVQQKLGQKNWIKTKIHKNLATKKNEK